MSQTTTETVTPLRLSSSIKCTVTSSHDNQAASNHSNGEAMATFSDLLRDDLKEYSGAKNLAFNEEVKKIMAEGKKIYHFGFGQTPFPVPEHFVEALKEHAGEMAYLPVAGIPELRQAICDLHERYDKVTFHKDQVIVGTGTKELILLMLTVFKGEVLLMSPSWTTYKPQTLLSGRKSHIISTDIENEWRLTPELVEETVQKNNITGNKVLILCNPDNPTGTTYTESQLRALASVFRKHNIIVMSDEIYSRLSYTQSHQTLAKYYPEGTILSSGMSKWASAGGWRLGYHIYPKELSVLLSAVKSAASHSYSCAPAPQQYAVAKGLSNAEACHDYILHTSRIMSNVGQFCTRELREEGVVVSPPYSGYYIFPNFEVLRGALKKRGITTGEGMCQAFIREANVALLAGGPAHLRPVQELTVRLCFVCFDGREALDVSKQLGLSTDLPEDFTQKYCSNVYHGIKIYFQPPETLALKCPTMV